MRTKANMHSHQQGAFESIASESQVPISDVSRRYANELARLENDAQVAAFLPIFAIRHARDSLRIARAGMTRRQALLAAQVLVPRRSTIKMCRSPFGGVLGAFLAQKARQCLSLAFGPWHLGSYTY